MVTWKKNWTMRKVVGVKKRDQIDQEIGEKAGDSAYIVKYANALNAVLESLSEEEKRKYMDLAEEWNKSHPPKEVQIRSVTGKVVYR
jgi:hypothetical protein